MRFSTLNLYETATTSFGNLQNNLIKVQQQIATGQRILTPSDDPISAARVLDVSQSQSINTQYGRNRQYANNTLVEVDGALSSVTALLQEVRDMAVASENVLLKDSDRAFQASELSSRFDQMLGLANTRDALGNYLFSGFQTDTPAFVKSATGATYQGDMGQQLLQVEATRQMAVSSPGQTVFQGGGQDIFQTLTDLINLLNTPVVTPADQANLTAGLTAALNNMDLALNNVGTVRASVGSRLQEIEALNIFGQDRNLQYSQALSELQDLDYAQALTKLSQQQTTLEAAQRSFATVSKLSLFNFI